jgi:hypothetical protein
MLVLLLTLEFRALFFVVTPKIFLSILHWQTSIIFFSLAVRGQVWAPYSRSGAHTIPVPIDLFLSLKCVP